MSSRLVLSFHLFSILLGFCAASLSGASVGSETRAKLQSETHAKLQLKISDYSLEEEDFARALLSFADKFNLPLGIEWVRSRETTAKVSLSWHEATVEKVLNQIVRTQPEYQVDTQGDVIHVFPAELHSSAKNFLNLRIDRFEIHNQVVEVASHRLRDLARPKVAPSQPVPKQHAGFAYSQATNVGDPEFSLTLKDATIRDILDHLVLASDRKIWVVTFTAEGAALPTGYRRAITLWNNTAIPDAEQPVWDMFRWNDPMPPVGG